MSSSSSSSSSSSFQSFMPLLPSEVFREIFLLLSPREKAKCMLVCQRWKAIIEEFALYHTLFFYSLSSLETFTKKVQDQPEIAKKVERLIIDVYSGHDPAHINLNPLFSSLTNVRSFFISCCCPTQVLLDQGKRYPFHDSIKYLYLETDILNCYRVTLSERCPDLKTLVVDFEYVPIDLLKNAPFLTRLELHRFKVSFSRLEVIHDALSHLQSLLVFYGWFHDMDNEYNDKNIMPANSVTTLELHICYMRPDCLRSRMNILDYIRKKYPNLSSLTYRSTVDWSSHDPDIRGLNKMAWRPLLCQLGPQLQKIQVDQNGYINQPFQLLDDAGCQLKYFRIGSFEEKLFLDMMAPSNQLHFIQTLVLEISPRIKVDWYDWLRQFVVLKKLKLCGPNMGSLNLYSVLENCPPLLDTLSLESTSLQLDPHHPNACHQIKTLSLYRTKLPYECDAFISQCLPKLSNLKLKDCDLLSRTFDLQTMDLDYFCFNDQFYLGKNNILVSTLCDDQKRWHSLIGGDFNKIGPIDTEIGSCSPHELRVSVRPASTFRIRPEFTLICHSVKKLIFSKIK